MIGPDFDHFCELVRARSGLVLTADKTYLVVSRLGPIARELKLSGPSELLARLRTGATEALVRRCVDAMATHESFFFRDGAPFDHLAQKVLPQVIDARRRNRSLRIWCAACSSGQEPYSVAMVLQDFAAQIANWQIEILATDMSEAILKKARSGLYSDFEVNRGLPAEHLKRWFVREGQHWRISPQLQNMITFREHNLLHGVSGLGAFDVIFCRNVLIYFDVTQKRSILSDLSRTLAGDGALFLGSAETVIGLSDAFELTPGARGLYRIAGARRLAAVAGAA